MRKRVQRAATESLKPRPGHHHGIIRAKPERRCQHGQAAGGGNPFKRAPHRAIGGDTPGHHQRGHPWRHAQRMGGTIRQHRRH